MKINRRRYERFALAPMYTPVAVTLLADSSYQFEGHAYDISEAGLRFELDQPLDPGTPVAIEVTLPGSIRGREEENRICAVGSVVWIDDDVDEPGPVRMAAAFTRFARTGDKQRLLAKLAGGGLSRAA